eukprot:403333881
MFGQIKRLASHAGSWYPSDKKKLDLQLTQYLEKAKIDLGDRIKDNSRGKIRAIIAPHAGIDYSGQVAAYAYCQLDPQQYKRVILLGPSHHVYLESCALTLCSKYQTPLGDLVIDKEFNEQLLKENSFKQMPKQIDEEEHSLEMHLPYIKKVFGDQIQLVPILVGNLTKDKEALYGKTLAKYLRDKDENLFIISSDFCHWGKDFDYMYLVEKVDKDQNTISKQIERIDKDGINHIIGQDVEKFNEYLDITDNTICGRHPIGVLLECLKEMDTRTFETELAQYGQSTNIIDDKRETSVSYASIVTRDKVNI